MICSVCECQETKYKCPRCLVNYCSATCYKVHKNEKCNEDNNYCSIDKNNQEINNENKDVKTHSSADSIDKEKLKCLETCDKLKDILKNPHLRTLLKTVDSCTEPEKMMQKVMLEPIFVEFVDTCLEQIEQQ